MRAVAAAAILAALVVVAPGEAEESLPACAWKAPKSGPRGLPATLSLQTRCADFHLLPNGSVRPNGHGILSDQPPKGSIGFTDGSWWRLRGGRLEVNRGGQRVWHSARRYPRLFQLEGAAVDSSAVAFTYASRLFVAAGGHLAVERPVARNERPLGWSRDGLLFTSRMRGEGGDVRLRGPEGAFISVVEPRPRAVRFDPVTRALLMVNRYGRVARFDGRNTTELADLRRLGMPVTSWIEPLAGGLIGVTASRRVAILRADGSLFASARFPPGRRWSAAANSGLVADPNGQVVALTLTEGNTGYASDGAEWLLVLREGDRVARVLHREPLKFAVCERWTTLAWQDRWLLYASTEGRTLALDTGRGRVVDLSRLVARLPGARPNGEGKVELTARWRS